MSRRITDKAEVSIDFPDKFYLGSFAGESRFDVSADDNGVHIWLERPGDEHRKAGFHLHYFLLADIFEAMAEAVGGDVAIGADHRRDLATAARDLATAFCAEPEEQAG